VKLKIAVSGGSVGGLTAALWLLNAGHDVKVFERSPTRLEGRGAGIVLHETTLRYLIEVGKVPVESISEGAQYLRYLSQAGNIVFEEETNLRFTSWNTLHRSLLSFLGNERYFLSRAVTGIDQVPNGVVVHSAGCPSEKFDLLVCAEGSSSPLRQNLLPNTLQLYSGYVGWRGVVDGARISFETRRMLENMIVYAVPPLNQVLSYEIPDFAVDGKKSSLINWIWYRNVLQGSHLESLMTDIDGKTRMFSLGPGTVRPDAIAELKNSSHHLPPQFSELIHATSEPFVQAIIDLDSPRMVFGRVCLVGDAAFTVRPHAAAGAAKAAEDGWSLAEKLTDVTNVEESLASWESERLTVGAKVNKRSREMGDRSQKTCDWYPEDQTLRFGLHGANN